MTPDFRSDYPAAADGRALRPVVARALELGRGPPLVIGWLAVRRPTVPARTDGRLVARIARDLARRLWPASGSRTLPGRPFGTVLTDTN